MTLWQHRRTSAPHHVSTAPIFCLVLASLLAAAATHATASKPLVLKQGDSRVLAFTDMTRVWVTEPNVVDVIVSSYDELLIYAKQVGHAKLHVWDANDHHEYAVQVEHIPTAEQVVRRLARVLGERFTYTIVDDQRIFVEGQADTEPERERVQKVLEAQEDGPEVISLVSVRGTDLTPAKMHKQVFEDLLPEQLRYTVLGPSTLAVDGEVGTVAEKKRVDQVLNAATGVEVLNFVRSLQQVKTAQQQRIETLKKAIGDAYEYQQMEDGVLIITGEAPSEHERDRIEQIIQAAGEGVTIVNLVSVPDQQVTPATKYAELLGPVLGDQYTLTTLGENILIVEGVTKTAAERQRIDELLTLVPDQVQVANLVRKPGLAIASSPAGKYQRVLEPVLDDSINLTVIDEQTLLVEGQVQNRAAHERTNQILQSVEDRITLLRFVSVEGEPTGLSPVETRERSIRDIIGDEYEIKSVGDNTIVVNGVAPSETEYQRVERLLEQLDGEIAVLNMVLRPEEASDKTPAQRAVAVLNQVLDNKLQARAVNHDTVIIDGRLASDQQREQIDALATQVAEGVNVVNLATIRPQILASERAAKYQQALRSVFGETITCNPLDENTVAVQGRVGTQQDKDRLSEIIGSLGDGLELVNLVTTGAGPPAGPQTAAQRQAQAIRELLGPEYTVTPAGPDTVVVKGTAADQAQMEHITRILQQIDDEITIVNMVTTDGPTRAISPAQQVVEKLRRLVPEGVNVAAIDHSTVLIEGIVPDEQHKQAADELAQRITESGNVSVIPFVLTKQQADAPLTDRIKHLEKAIGDGYTYMAWAPDTIVVQGTADNQAELQQVQKIVEAASDDMDVVSLVTLPEGQQPVDVGPETTDVVRRLTRAIGDRYRVWPLRDGEVVVEGIAADEAALQRANKLIEAFSDKVHITNLIAVAPQPEIPLIAQAETLRSVLGDPFQVKTIQGKTIIVEAVVRNEKEAERAQQVIDALKQDAPVVNLVTVADPKKRQVIAHVKVLDIDRGSIKKLGVDWGELTSGQGGAGFSDQPILVKVQEGVDFVNQLATNIQALTQTDTARMLAEPNLVTNEGETAEMTVGGEIPIPVPQMGTGTTSVTIDYKQYGVVLKLTPEILDDEKTIQLQIEPEVSSVDPATTVSIAGISVPGFRTRRAKTQVNVPDGGALVIGGLLRNDQSKAIRKIPLLGDLPIIGQLFTSETWQRGTSELVILVMPEILKASK